jgi:hypothetical protein
VGVGGATAAGGGPGNGGSVTANGGALPGAGGATSSGGAGTVSNGGSGTTNGGALPGAGGAAPGAGGAAPGAGGMACQTAETKFEPKIPTVYVMVDRSGSMFDCLSTSDTMEPSCGASNMMQNKNDTPWVKLREATLQVIQSLQAEVRFGFAAFTGTNPNSGGMCPIIDKVPPNFGNYDAIAKVYNELAFQPETTESGKKFETPAHQALANLGKDLLADPTPGDKFILFVTDGEPDYCTDENGLCAPDSVVASLQGLKKQGITTIVMGLQSTYKSSNISPDTLQAFANAGMGEPTKAPVRGANETAQAFYDQCSNIPGWNADRIALMKPATRQTTLADGTMIPTTLGEYSATSGPTKPRTPEAADQAGLLKELTAALSGVKSCTFDLSNVNGKSIKVDLNQLAAAEVKIENAKIPLDMTNGWGMANATQLVLTGTACDTWRKPETDDIAFNFPCDTIIFE